MKYSPKLKKAMEEIKAILDQYDIAGAVILHTPGFTEYLNKIDPSYSCAKMDGDAFRIKNTHIKDEEEKKKFTRDTLNMLHCLSEGAGMVALNLITVSEIADSKFDVNHFGGGHTSNQEQNN